MVSAEQQFTSSLSEPNQERANEVVLNGSEHNDSGVNALEEQLRTLTVRYGFVQERFRAARNALAAIINLFGPETLSSEQQRSLAFGVAIPPPSSQKLDLCRNILQNSHGWLTLNEILERVRFQSPLLLARYRFPGCCVSNMLRTLVRRGEIQVRLEDGKRRWRWIVSKPPE